MIPANHKETDFGKIKKESRTSVTQLVAHVYIYLVCHADTKLFERNKGVDDTRALSQGRVTI